MDLSEMLLWVQNDIVEREPDHAGDRDANHPELAYGWLLAAMGAHSPGPIVEIGTDGGLSTAALAFAASQPVHTFDIRPDRVEHARDRLGRAGLSRVHCHLGTSQEVRELSGVDYIGLGFVDGDHSLAWVLKDTDELSRFADRRTRIILHDFIDATNPGRDMNGVRAAAVRFLNEHPDWIGCPLDNYSGFFVLAMATDLRG